MKPCRSCGLSDRYPDGRCRPCRARKRKIYYRNGVAKEREYRRKYQSENREKSRAANRRWREKTGYRQPRYRLYGLSEADYNEMLVKQDERCAICKEKPIAGLCIDHSHYNGAVRGLLCLKCNAGIGMLRDNVDILMSAIEYIKKAS